MFKTNVYTSTQACFHMGTRLISVCISRPSYERMCVGGKDITMDLHNILLESRQKLKTWRELYNLFLKSTLLQMLLHQALIVAD